MNCNLRGVFFMSAPVAPGQNVIKSVNAQMNFDFGDGVLLSVPTAPGQNAI